MSESVHVAGDRTDPPTLVEVATDRPPSRRPSAWTISRTAALVVLALSTALVALLPVAGKQVTYSWNPPESFTYGRVQLMMPATPQRLAASWPCSALRSVAPATGGFPREFFSTGYSTAGELTAWIGDAGVAVFLAGRPVVGATLPVPSGECTLRLEYDDATRSVTLANDQQSRTVPLKTSVVRDTDAIDSLQVTGLDVPRELRTVVSVEVTARPSTQEWTGWRWVIALSGLCAVLYLLWSFFRESRPGPPGEPTPRWTGSDTTVAVASVAALLLIPPLADDGWVLTTVRAFPQLGFFSNYFTADAAVQPEGFWWTSIERIWMTPLGTSILALRVPSLVIAVLCWWFLRRRVIDQIGDRASLRWVRALAASVYVIGLFSWMPTLRPEPLIALLSVIALALVLRLRARWDGWVLVALAITAALAFSAHQTGWVVIGVAAAAWPDVRRWWRAGDSDGRVALVVAVATFLGATILLMLLKSNLAILLQARESFISGGKHNAVFDEALRIRGLLNSVSTSPLRLLSAMLVPTVALGWALLVRSGWPRGQERLAAGAAALGGVFLVFTSSKWQWHFGATIAISACAAALLARRESASRAASAVLIGAVALLGFAATSRVSGWALQDLRVVGVDSPLLSLGSRVLLWGAVSIGSIWLLRGTGRRTRSIVAAAMATVTIVAGVSVAPLVVDGVREPTTSWPALVAGSVAPGACGLASEMRVATVTEPVSKSPGQPAPAGLSESTWGSDIAQPMPPVRDVTTLRPIDGFPAPLTTPWYQVNGNETARTWIHVNQPSQLEYSVEWLTTEGTPGSRQVRRLVQAPSWVLVDLQVPAEAEQVRVGWTNSPAIDTVLSPVVVLGSAPVTALAAGPVLRTPASAMNAPCFSQPDISSGSLSPFRWSLGLPLLGSSAVATGVAVFSEQACVDNPSSDWYPPLCWYSVTVPTAEGLTTSERTVSR